MNILVIGGTRFFGIHMVNELLTAGYDVTIATRGKASDSFGDIQKRIGLPLDIHLPLERMIIQKGCCSM